MHSDDHKINDSKYPQSILGQKEFPLFSKASDNYSNSDYQEELSHQQSTRESASESTFVKLRYKMTISGSVVMIETIV